MFQLRYLIHNLSWSVKVENPKPSFADDNEIIRKALVNPVASSGLSEIVNSEKIALIVDDVTRPISVNKLLHHILQELYNGMC